MQLTFLIFGLLGLFDLTFAVMTTAGELPWPLEVMQYSGTLGGYDVQLNGTVQEIFAQVSSLGAFASLHCLKARRQRSKARLPTHAPSAEISIDTRIVCSKEVLLTLKYVSDEGSPPRLRSPLGRNCCWPREELDLPRCFCQGKYSFSNVKPIKR